MLKAVLDRDQNWDQLLREEREGIQYKMSVELVEVDMGSYKENLGGNENEAKWPMLGLGTATFLVTTPSQNSSENLIMCLSPEGYSGNQGCALNSWIPLRLKLDSQNGYICCTLGAEFFFSLQWSQ